MKKVDKMQALAEGLAAQHLKPGEVVEGFAIGDFNDKTGGVDALFKAGLSAQYLVITSWRLLVFTNKSLISFPASWFISRSTLYAEEGRDPKTEIYLPSSAREQDAEANRVRWLNVGKDKFKTRYGWWFKPQPV